MADNNTVHNPHDSYFRATMKNIRVAKSFFTNHLPEKLLKNLDLDSLTFINATYIDKYFKRSASDVLYSVKLEGHTTYLYVYVEHQSQPDRMMAYRALKYTVNVMEQHQSQNPNALLPLVYPLVFYHGKTLYPYSTDIFDLIDDPLQMAREVLFQPFHLIDVNRIEDEVLKKQLWSGVMEFVFKHINDEEMLPAFREIVLQLTQLEKDGGADIVDVTLYYVVKAGQFMDFNHLQQIVHEGLSQQAEEKFMTIAEQLTQMGHAQGVVVGMEKGMEKGMQKGMLEGKLQAQRTIAKEMLREGFDIGLVAKVTRIPQDELEGLVL